MTGWEEIVLDVANVTQEQRPKSREIFYCNDGHHSHIRHYILAPQRRIPKHIARGIISSLAHCGHAKRSRWPSCCSCYFPEYRSMLRELHATSFHVATCIACMNHRGTLGTRRMQSKRQNFVDAVVIVGYNIFLHTLTRRQLTSGAANRIERWVSPEQTTRG